MNKTNISSCERTSINLILYHKLNCFAEWKAKRLQKKKTNYEKKMLPHFFFFFFFRFLVFVLCWHYSRCWSTEFFERIFCSAISMFIPLAWLLFPFFAPFAFPHSQSSRSFLIFNAFPRLIHSFISNMNALLLLLFFPFPFHSFSSDSDSAARSAFIFSICSPLFSFVLASACLFSAHCMLFFSQYFFCYPIPMWMRVYVLVFFVPKKKGRCYLSSVVW